MNVKYINPFVESIIENIKKLAQIEVEKQKPSITVDLKPLSDISAVIGLGGEVKGSVVISLPKDVALAIASKMFMEELKELNNEVKDAIGEFANIMIGNARSKLVDAGFSISISTPTMIIGNNHAISHPENVPFVVIPFKTIMGTFFVNVGIKDIK